MRSVPGAGSLVEPEEELRRRVVVTPEGVPLVFTVAAVGERAGAFLIDAGILVAGALVVLLLAGLASGLGAGWVLAIVMLVLFVWRSFYFTLFELRWQGRTPGKRAMGLRVIDAGGGMLGSNAVFTRNLTREVEFFAPLIAAIEPELVLGGGGGWLTFLALLWLLVFAALPLFNRDRMRAGDLIAGTLVVRKPSAVLLQDLASASASAPEAASLHFTAEQLDVYGIYELQVLEEVLRERRSDPRALRAVADKIRAKIGWPADQRVRDREFLQAFYKAQRARLEGALLLGRARERKR